MASHTSPFANFARDSVFGGRQRSAWHLRLPTREDRWNPVLVPVNLPLSSTATVTRWNSGLGSSVMSCPRTTLTLGAILLFVPSIPVSGWEAAGWPDSFRRHGRTKRWNVGRGRSSGRVGEGEGVRVWVEEKRWWKKKTRKKICKEGKEGKDKRGRKRGEGREAKKGEERKKCEGN